MATSNDKLFYVTLVIGILVFLGGAVGAVIASIQGDDGKAIFTAAIGSLTSIGIFYVGAQS